MYSLQLELKNDYKVVAIRYYGQTLGEIESQLQDEFLKVKKEFNK